MQWNNYVEVEKTMSWEEEKPTDDDDDAQVEDEVTKVSLYNIIDLDYNIITIYYFCIIIMYYVS